MSLFTPLGRILGLLFLSTFPALAGYKDEIGYTKLQAELSSALPTGANISVTQVEASTTASPIITSLPDTSLMEFSEKSFNNKTSSTNVSDHATSVAKNFYSTSNSIAPGVTTIDVYNASTWINGSFLRAGTTSAPRIESRDVQNHSWIGSTGNASGDEDILRRVDFAIQRDDFMAVFGLNNGFGNPVPSLLGSSYNGLSVGLSNGNHSSGTTNVDGTGRSKPDIVAPEGATSFATPEVGAAAALLLNRIRSDSTYANADHSVVVKALLLAGATKTEFPTWSRSSTQPLDVRYGVGQLNIYRSYYDLVAGQQIGSPSVDVKSRGWDYNSTSSTTSRLYFFDVAANDTASGFSAVLTWNRNVSRLVSTYTPELADLSLKLYLASEFTVGAVYDSSVSPVDNVEHIYQPNLPPGRYALEVSSASSTSTDYGLAWTSVPTIQIAATTPDASENGFAPGVFTITRSGDTTNITNVFYTVGGSASNGTDYSSIASFVTFAAGETTKSITISPLADNVSEGNENVSLTLVSDIAYGLDTSTTASVAIHDLPFDAWRFGKFTSAELADSTISEATADPDSDGISNLLEYALNLEPLANSTVGLPVTELENGVPTLIYTRVKSATDLVYLPEISEDLLTWQSGDAYLTEIILMDNGPTETIKATPTTSAAGSVFLRLRVTRQ